MKLLVIISSFLIFNPSAALAQRKVKSNSYNLILKKLVPSTIPAISVDSLLKIEKSVILLDAREPGEFEVSHIDNAVFVGYNNFSIDSLKNLAKDSPIVVYCSVGYRSAKIAEKLVANGFTNVKNLYGGIFEWKNENHNVYNSNGITEQVHAYNKTWGMWLKKGIKVYDK